MISSRKKHPVHAGITFKKLPHCSTDTQPSSEEWTDAVELQICLCYNNMAIIWVLQIFFIVTETVVCSCDTEETDTTELLFCAGLGQAAQADGPFRIQSQNTGIFLISFICGWQDFLQMWLVIQLWWTYLGQGNPGRHSLLTGLHFMVQELKEP